MSRRKASPKRQILPDPKFHNGQLAKFINHLMVDGKKSVAEKIVYQALDKVEQQTQKEPIKAFSEAIDKIKPLVEVKSRRVGGATYPVPMEVRPARQETLSMRWLIDAAKKRNEKSMFQRLAGEMNDALQGKGSAMKKREDVHRMAEANRAFSHYRF